MTITKFLNDVFNGGLVTMIITLVLSLGLGFTVAEVLDPMRRWVVMLAMVAFDGGLIPAIAWGVCKPFPITPSTARA
jgi:predicted Na+-dependent transporter